MIKIGIIPPGPVFRFEAMTIRIPYLKAPGLLMKIYKNLNEVWSSIRMTGNMEKGFQLIPDALLS